MDKVPAIILSILLVVAVFGVIFFDKLAPSMEDKTDEVIVDLDGLNFNDN